MKAAALALGIFSAATIGGLAGAAAQTAPVPITIVVFTPPSLGAVFPAVIKQQKYDIANGIDINFVERPPDAYAAQFNSGEFKVGGSASILILGLGATRGIKVSYLFNLFDYWSTVVTNKPDIKTLADLKGREVAAAKGTTNYTVFEWFAQRAGVDPKSIKVLNTATAGLLGYALADRADAVALWEPAYSMLIAKRPGIRAIDLAVAKTWADYAGGKLFPNLGVGRAPGLDRRQPRADPEALPRLQAGRRLGRRPSERGRTAGRAGQGGGRTQGDRRHDPRQFAARLEHLPRERSGKGDRGGLSHGRRGRAVQDPAGPRDLGLWGAG